MPVYLGLDIGSNSVGSAWVDTDRQAIHTGVSIFPAGVEESDEKRGKSKNVERRDARRTRITLARKAKRKRELRLKLIAVGLLPSDADQFQKLLAETDPFTLRRKALKERLSAHEFGRVLLHLAQRRGALGFDADIGDKGKVKSAITRTQLGMLEKYGGVEAREMAQALREKIESLTKRKKRTEQENDEIDKAQNDLKELCRSLFQDPCVTFGRFMADLRDERRTPITTPDRRKEQRGPREWCRPIRNRRAQVDFHADRTMIRDEFAKLWDAQKRFGGPLADLLTPVLRRCLDDESRDSVWKHKGLLFGQRRTYWDTGTLGRCVLEPTDRCVPIADRHASYFRVVETVNNIRIRSHNGPDRPLTPTQRADVIALLRGPLGVHTKGKQAGKPKHSVSVADIKTRLKTEPQDTAPALNLDNDENREINTDWFHREIVHGAIGLDLWSRWEEAERREADIPPNRRSPEAQRPEAINRAILKFDPEDDADESRLRAVAVHWELESAAVDRLVAAWKCRPKLEKRLNLSRRAILNLLPYMERFDDENKRWPTQQEARKAYARVLHDRASQKGTLADRIAAQRYDDGAKGATARDRHYMKKHLLKKNGQPVFGPDGLPLHEPPPAPLISNPVVRKAIHEVRRHVIEYMRRFQRKPDAIYIELCREAKMGKEDADRTLFMNRLRNRIRKEIIDAYDLGSLSSTQQKEAVKRVLLCVQQGAESAICPLCGQHDGLTPRNAANGTDCEIAHIIPRGAGGDNRSSNIVLAHIHCNQRMKRRTPRQFWEAELQGGFEEGMRWIEAIYGNIQRIKPSEIKTATGMERWKCYFTTPSKHGNFFLKQNDLAKIEQFKKDIKDIQRMTPGQAAATAYAAKQVMTYLADALYDGKGLPERGGIRRIYATDGLWTSRLRREWGLFFDPHGFKTKGLTNQQKHERKEKDRGDHHHHAIDAVVIALCSRDVQMAWEEREGRAERDGINTADEEAMDHYRRLHPLPTPAPFNSREGFREAVRRAVFSYPEEPDWLRAIFDGRAVERPICHRPVKRKLIGALHKETLFGTVLDSAKQLTDYYTVKQSVLDLDANHLRLPVEESRKDAIKRLTAELKSQGVTRKVARQKAEAILNDPQYKPRQVDPPTKNMGIVRDVNLRRILREQIPQRHREVCEKLKQQLSQETDNKTRKDIENALQRLGQSINLDQTGVAAKKKFQQQLKIILNDGPLCMPSGVPIHSVVLLRSMNDPVIASRWATDYASGQRCKVFDAITGQGDAAQARAYDSQNNHHIEIRCRTDKKGKEIWSGAVVTAFEVAQQLITRLRRLKALEKPFRHLRKPVTQEQRKSMSKDERDQLSKRQAREWKRALHDLRPQRTQILNAHPLVNRADNDTGRFVMSLCEGEMLLMKDKRTGEVGYFVVAKLTRPHSIVLVPHWDARSATGRKDADGNKKVDNSKREQFSVTPTDLKKLAPPGYPHAIKVRVGPLGDIAVLEND